MIIVGFDWARDKHDVCVQSPSGEMLYAGVVKHDADALELLRTRLAELEPDPAAVCVALEQHDGALLAWLLEAGYTVYGINPKSADRACDTHVLQALTDFAFTTAFSVSGCWSFSFYERKRREGRDHHESLRTVALRWVKILWAMWNAGTA